MRLEFGRFVFFVLIGAMGCNIPEVPRAREGVLDLTRWSWQENGNLALNGGWAFYWQELLSPQSPQLDEPNRASYTEAPGVWPTDTISGGFFPGTGYATYRLKVQLPADSVPLTLRVNTASTAMRIWVNGEEVYRVGRVAADPQSGVPGFRPEIVPLPSASSLDVVIHLSNYHYRKGGLWDALTIGPNPLVLQDWIRDYATAFFLVGSFMIMALYHLILYLHRRRDPSSLFFSIICLLIVVRTFSTDLYLIADFLPWSWVVRAELLSFYLCVPLFAAFAYTIYPTALPRSIVKIGTLITAAFCIGVLLLPPLWFSFTVIPFEIFAVTISAYGFYRLLSVRWTRLDGIHIFLLGFVAVLITLINDSLHANRIISTFYMAPLGLFAFLFSQSVLLSRRYSRLANALERSNRQLARKNRQIEEKNDALIKLNQEMDAFVYRTSHDLRAPLTSLLGIITLIRNETISAAVASYLELQERSIRKLDSFVREILDYSRNSRLDVVPQTIDFRTLIEETYTLYSHLPQYSTIDQQVTVVQTVPFVGDIKRWEVILNNLVSNALRYFNPYQDHPFIRIHVEVNEAEASLRIEDNGVGIAPEHLDRIFNMFYRATSRSDGTGLGLFLVKETVEKMDGSIRVHSAVNQGTTFIIDLPNQLASSPVEN